MSILRESAKNQPCFIRLPGCNHDKATTVLCHLNGAGIALKHDDFNAAFGCYNCHQIVDSVKPINGISADQIKLAFYDGMVRTQKFWQRHGYIEIKKPIFNKISSFEPEFDL